MPNVLDHIALATHRIADAPNFLAGELGGVSGYGGPSGTFRWWHWDYEGGGRIEVLEPDGPPGGFVHRYLERRGSGIHHVNFEVPSLKQACERAEQLGQTVVGYDDSHEIWKEAFLHPKGAMGIVIQFVQTVEHGHDHEVDGDWHRPADKPPGPPNPPPPVEIIGLRMRTADRDAALRQWGELLGGELEDRDSELIFRWPGSPMRVAVSLDPGAANEAVAVEVRAGRPLILPEGPHPQLGTIFVQLADND